MSKAMKVGVVTQDKMQKTVVVAVERLVRHHLYRRSFKKTSTFLAHDEENRCRVGDRVRIVEIRPLSRRKRWRVMEVISAAPIPAEAAEAALTSSPAPEGES
jgi:small subunit ribosomal protein S17